MESFLLMVRHLPEEIQGLADGREAGHDGLVAAIPMAYGKEVVL